MKVTIIKNKNGILESVEDKIKSGYEEENRAYTLQFEFPDFLEEYNKIIEFNFDGNKEYDLIQDNEYILKNNVTKYSFIPCQIVFTKEEDEHTRVFKTNIFYLDFSESINADIEIDPESEDVKLLNTLIESVNLTVEEVSTLKDEVTLLAEETRLKGEYAQMQGDYAKEQGNSAKEEVDKIETMLEGGELNGATFTPSVSDSGDISWTNDKDLPNPETKNIKGDTGLTPDISVGSTTTLSPGTNAYVEILGTKENPIINFYIPRGDNGRIEFRLVNQLPVTGEEGIVYLVPEIEPEQGNRYDEYIWINNGWEKFGSASIDIDLDKYYTKEEIATILLDYVTNSSLTQTLSNYVTNQGLTTTLLDYVTKTDLSTELADYVKFTDYGTGTKAGVLKAGNSLSINGTGQPVAIERTYEQYNSMSNTNFIGKGTLENFVAGKELVNKTYVDDIVGDIGTILDNINGESVGG